MWSACGERNKHRNKERLNKLKMTIFKQIFQNNCYLGSSNSTKAKGGPRLFFKSIKVIFPNLKNKSSISLVRISGGKLPT